MISEEYVITQKDIVDGEEAAIREYGFTVSSGQVTNTVTMIFGMYPDESVIDASPEDFPEFECVLTVRQFKDYLKMLMRVDEKL